jgi:glycosyltransferase involved in cell wall biosynthesis
MTSPSLSVIIPVLNGESLLPRSVEALERSTILRDQWELLIVDDGSTDGTATLAESMADTLLRVENGPRGPAFARNLGARRAGGDVLVFVDADVCVDQEALSRFRQAFRDAEGLGAAFGTYDDHPEQADFLSQYRNLYHRYVHLNGAGPAETFWAGCGAVRREVFLELGGFDVTAFPRPQIEDIELGYRIRDAGYDIVLDPRIEGTHLKRWALPAMVRTDLFDRGIPWMRLLLGAAADGRKRSLNVGHVERIKVALMGLVCLLTAMAILLLDVRWLYTAGAPLLLLIGLNFPVYRWFARSRGTWFAMRVVPVHILYYLISGLSVAIAVPLHFAGAARGRGARPGGAAG